MPLATGCCARTAGEERVTTQREPATHEDVFGKSAPRVVEEEDNFDADRVFSRLKDVDFGE